MKLNVIKRTAIICVAAITALAFTTFKDGWQSKLVTLKPDGSLTYNPDDQGNTLPDFSRVGYHEGDMAIPDVPVVKTVDAPKDGIGGQQLIQDAINEVAKMPVDANGFRGTILLKKGVYKVADTVCINASGIVLRGEGSGKDGTLIIATGKGQRTLINAYNRAQMREIPGTRVKITNSLVPTGAMWVTVSSAEKYKVGDSIILYRPGTENWIHDLKMDQIAGRSGTKQWTAGEYNLKFERVITKIEGDKIYMDNPVVMQIDARYGGGYIFGYTYKGRLQEIGVENLRCESEYNGDEDEDHGWNAVGYNAVKNSWVRNVASRYFGYSCVHLTASARNITVTDCICTDAKSKIDGGRRYSFDNSGQLNLFKNCHAEDGRHDYVTGAKVCGPNVFYNCTATKTHADIGPHHRWTCGTLYDNIVTDGEINVQDRGNYGSGHGWAGVTQILWNCTAAKVAVQQPWVSGQNYCIGLKGNKEAGRFKDRMEGYWEGQNKQGLEPASLYMAQLKARHLK